MTDSAVYSELIYVAEHAFARNRHLRAQSDRLRDELSAILVTHRSHRFPHLAGGSDTRTEEGLRPLLRDFVSGIEPAKSFVGFSRGSACHACGNRIAYGAMEYDIVSGTSEIRLDADCYKVFIEESGAVTSGGSPDAT